jgi:hypothetical protein
MGIPTFGTVDLLRFLAKNAAIDLRLAEAAEATLVRHYHGDLGFNAAVMSLAAQEDGWRPMGTAFALTRPFTWERPQDVMGFVIDALNHQLDRSPDELQAWITATSIGLVRATENASGASGNLQILLGQLIGQWWMRPDRFPHVLAGVREGIRELTEVEDPLRSVLSSQYRNLAERYGHPAAAQLLLALVRLAPEEDRRTAAHVILTTQ